LFNQTAMNVIAAGTAIPQPNGDIKLVTMGSFPVAVNRTGTGIVDFELEVTLPNPKAPNNQSLIALIDQTAPRVTAWYPSACAYTYGAWMGDRFGLHDVEAEPLTEISVQEDKCAKNTPPLSYGPRGEEGPAGVSTLLVRQNPAVVFSEPIDPVSLTPH